MINMKKLVLKYKYKYLFIIILIIAISIINTLLPYIIKQAITLAENNVEYNVIRQKLLSLITIYLIVTVICAILEFTKKTLLAKNTENLIYEIRENTYKKIMNFNMDAFSNMHISTLVTRMTADISNIGEFFGSVLPMFISSGIFLIVILSVMCFVNIYFALVMVICSIFLVISIFIIGKIMAYNKKKEIEVGEKLNNYFGETFSGIKTLHIFNIQKQRRNILDEYNKDELNASNKYFNAHNILTPIKSTTRYLIIAIIIYICMQGKIANMDIGIIYLVISYIDKFFEPLSSMLWHYEDLQKGRISLQRIEELLGEERNIENIYKGEKAERLDGNIKFTNVNFAYVEGTPILENVNFSINRGEKIALVGETGAGKTTIVNLILGFYKINSGNIFFDGKNIDDISLESIRKNISFIQQNPYIFDEPVKRNIALNSENEISDERILEILKLTRTL